MEQTVRAEAHGLISFGPVTGAPEPRFTKVPRPGEPAPWFHAATPDNPRFSFDTVAGRRVVLSFFGDMPESELRPLLMQVRAAAPALAAAGGIFFGVSTCRGDAHADLIKELLPGGHLFLDRDHAVSRAYGVAFVEGNQVAYRSVSFVMDERLRVADVAPMAGDTPARHVQRLVQALQALPTLEPERTVGVPAPVLVVPHLNTGDYQGGLLRFPEFGRQLYQAPAGGALVFS